MLSIGMMINLSLFDCHPHFTIEQGKSKYFLKYKGISFINPGHSADLPQAGSGTSTVYAYHLACSRQILAYSPCFSSSSSCRPHSAIFPSFMTIILSALRQIPTRWEMITEVLS